MKDMNLDSNGLEVLDRGECLALMGSVPIGRLVFTDRALPAIQPVNFVLDGDEVIVRTAKGSKLAAATRRAIVAFETDDFDIERQTGWSVTIVGQAAEITDPVRLRRVSGLPLEPWSPGSRDHFIGISAEQVTGRRILPRHSRDSRGPRDDHDLPQTTGTRPTGTRPTGTTTGAQSGENERVA